MNDAASAAPTYQQVIAAWNAQADEHNQWSELGEDEKVEWAVACAKTTPPAVVEPPHQPKRTVTYVCPVCAASLERQE